MCPPTEPGSWKFNRGITLVSLASIVNDCTGWILGSSAKLTTFPTSCDSVSVDQLIKFWWQASYCTLSCLMATGCKLDDEGPILQEVEYSWVWTDATAGFRLLPGASGLEVVPAFTGSIIGLCCRSFVCCSDYKDLSKLAPGVFFITACTALAACSGLCTLGLLSSGFVAVGFAICWVLSWGRGMTSSSELDKSIKTSPPSEFDDFMDASLSSKLDKSDDISSTFEFDKSTSIDALLPFPFHWRLLGCNFIFAAFNMGLSQKSDDFGFWHLKAHLCTHQQLPLDLAGPYLQDWPFSWQRRDWFHCRFQLLSTFSFWVGLTGCQAAFYCHQI